MFTFSPMGYEKWLSITLSSFMFSIITLSICSDVLKWIKMIGLKALESSNILYMYNIGLIALSSDKPQAKTFNYTMTIEWKVSWVELSMAVLSIPFFVSFLLIYVNPWLNQTSNHSKLVIYLILVWRAAVLSPRFNDLHVVYIYIVLPTTIMCNMRDNIVFPRDLPVRPCYTLTVYIMINTYIVIILKCSQTDIYYSCHSLRLYPFVPYNIPYTFTAQITTKMAYRSIHVYVRFDNDQHV